MRASRGWPLLVLVLVLGLLGPPAVASASDAGLRKVVQRELVVEKRLNAAERRVAAVPTPKTYPAYVRLLRRIVGYYARVERNVVALHRAYRRERAQTAQAARGRVQLLRGHRDLRNGAHESAVAVRRGLREVARARTTGTFRRAQRRMVRVLNAQDTRIRRGNARLKRGRRLIREAPAPPAPAPAPGAPAPAPAPVPAPAPAPGSPSPSRPGSLLPGVDLPLLPGLLGR